jgi:hypothetical protein
MGVESMAIPETPVSPMLRLEPNPLFYLRSARAYAFLRNFLISRMGEDALRRMFCLKINGIREKNLLDELDWFVDFSYGCYLVCCDDIGLKPDLMKDELTSKGRASAKNAALEWLDNMKDDPDLAVDTRVAVPIMRKFDGGMKVWATIGVRLAKLKVGFASGHGPMLRENSESGWVKPRATASRTYYLPVDAFVEVFNSSGWYPDRAELRDICDEYSEKNEIITVLESMR